MTRRPRRSPLFPYTTLFRSHHLDHDQRRARDLLLDAELDGLRGGVPEVRHRGRVLRGHRAAGDPRSEEHTSELQSRGHLVCRLLLAKKQERSTAAALTKDIT